MIQSIFGEAKSYGLRRGRKGGREGGDDNRGRTSLLLLDTEVNRRE